MAFTSCSLSYMWFMALLLMMFAEMLLAATDSFDDLDVQRKKLIIDTDLSTDCDDVGALCLAHALADEGLIDLLAVVHNSGLVDGVGAISSINNYYGRNDIPLGAFKGDFGSRLPGTYASDLVSRFPGPIRNYTQVPEAVATYREVLAAQVDRSVTIASIGFLTNIAALLRSPADSHSPLNGTALVATKVSQIVVMGGAYPTSDARFEWNFGGGNQDNMSLPDRVSSKASSFTFSNLPSAVEVIFNGFHVGEQIFTGAKLTSCVPSKNPCRQAYIDKQGPSKNRESWDPVTVLLSAVGVGFKDFRRHADGHCVVNHVNGSNIWLPSGNQSWNETYLELKDGRNISIAENIDTLLCKPPLRRFATRKVTSFV